jgi:hypothetical protein
MSLIGIARFRRDMRETSTPKCYLPQRTTETLNGCILLGGKPSSVAKMALKRAGNHTDGSGQRGNACAAIQSRYR